MKNFSLLPPVIIRHTSSNNSPSKFVINDLLNHYDDEVDNNDDSKTKSPTQKDEQEILTMLDDINIGDNARKHRKVRHKLASIEIEIENNNNENVTPRSIKEDKLNSPNNISAVEEVDNQIAINKQGGEFQNRQENYKKNRKKSSFFNSGDFSKKGFIPILVPVNIEQIEESPSKTDKSADKSNCKSYASHLIISPVNAKNRIQIKQLSENTVINGIDLDFNIRNISLQDNSGGNDEQLFNKISIVSMNNKSIDFKSEIKENSKSMTISDLLKLIRQRSMDNSELTNQLNFDSLHKQ